MLLPPEWSQYFAAAGLQGARSSISTAPTAVIDKPRRSVDKAPFIISQVPFCQCLPLDLPNDRSPG